MTPKNPPPPHQTPESANGAARKKHASKSGLATLVLHHSITFLILVLILGLGVWSYLNFQNTDFLADLDRTELEEKLRPPLEESQRQRIEVSLEVWMLANNRYPAYLDELVEVGLLMPSDLYYPRAQSRWTYQRLGEGFTLTPGTPEDDS